MAFPTAVKNWIPGFLVNQRIPFVSLSNTTGAYITGITNHQIARGYVCVGSSNGVTAAMDGVNRCTTSAGFATRSSVAASAQSWIVVSDGTVQTLFAFQGASDDVVRISFSPGSLFVVAGIPTQQPTATDEQVISLATSVIGSSPSADRVFHVWVDSAHQMWRACVMRLGIVVTNVIGVELFDPSLLVLPAVAPVPVWGFSVTPSNSGLTTLIGLQSSSGKCRLVVSGVPFSCSTGGYAIIMNASFTGEDGANLELNGNVPPIRSIGLSSITGGARGQIGPRFDWYFSSDNQPNGVTGGGPSGKEWVFLCDSASASGRGTLWPWDGVSVVVTA
jgi:hypothetical protein